MLIVMLSKCFPSTLSRNPVFSNSSGLKNVFEKFRFRYGLLRTVDLTIERFSTECRKTKTKVITLANHRRHRQHNEPIKIRGNYM